MQAGGLIGSCGWSGVFSAAGSDYTGGGRTDLNQGGAAGVISVT